MIYHLKGSVISVSGDMAVIDVNGVGYGVMAPSRLIGTQIAEGMEISIHTITIVSQDDIRLFGFLSPMDREFFKMLLNIPRLGPRGALKILSSAPATVLMNAVISQDVRTLTKIPGVGGKMASRLIMELKEKVKNLAVVQEIEYEDGFDELSEILSGLGSTPAETAKVVARVKENLPDEKDPDRLLSEALAIMAEGEMNQ